MGVNGIDQPTHLVRKILPGTPVGDADMPPTDQRFKAHEQIGRSVTLVLGIVASYLTGLRQTGRANLINKLLATFVKADDRFQPVVRLFINSQHIFHGGHECCAGFRNTPFLYLPGFDLIFFNVWRTVSCETLSTTSSATNFSANTRILQWACPSGQSLHARAMRCASARPSSRRFWPGRASSVSAPLNPRSTKRWRVRSTVVRAVSNALAMSSSVHPSLAFNRICARFIFRAEISPLCVICSNSVRST